VGATAVAPDTREWEGTVPADLEELLEEEPRVGGRSEQLHVFIGTCINRELPDETILDLAERYKPAVDKYEDRVRAEAERSLGKWRAADEERAVEGCTETYTSPRREKQESGGVQEDGRAATQADTDSQGFDELVEEGVHFLESEDDTHAPELISTILVAGGVAACGGEPKVGTTWLIISLALSVATGRAFLGRYEVVHSGPVLYIGAEGSRGGAKRRFRALARGYGLDPVEAMRNIKLIWRRSVMLDDRSFMAWLEHRGEGYALVIVDVLTKAWGGNENSNEEMGALVRALERVTRTGATILLVHHLGKMTEQTATRRLGQRLRGASALHGSIDSGLYLERGKDQERTRVTLEAKDSAEAEPFTFAWPREEVDGTEPVTLDWQPGEHATGTAASVLPALIAFVQENPGLSRSDEQIRKGLVCRKDVALAAIKLALETRQLHERKTPYVNRAGAKRTRMGLYAGPPQMGEEGLGNVLRPVPESSREADLSGTGREAFRPGPDQSGTVAARRYSPEPANGFRTDDLATSDPDRELVGTGRNESSAPASPTTNPDPDRALSKGPGPGPGRDAWIGEATAGARGVVISGEELAGADE
jgi:hypothetical protein